MAAQAPLTDADEQLELLPVGCVDLLTPPAPKWVGELSIDPDPPDDRVIDADRAKAARRRLFCAIQVLPPKDAPP